MRSGKEIPIEKEESGRKREKDGGNPQVVIKSTTHCGLWSLWSLPMEHKVKLYTKETKETK